MKAKPIGVTAHVPEKECSDRHCPYHGSLKVRGRTFTGSIIKAGMHRTVTVEWERPFYIPKYERYEKRRTRIKAHNPDCMAAKVGDKVMIAESRPISKTKNFVVVEVVRQNAGS